MGGYLCIASNGVPPSVSKRYDVQINFSPSVKAGNQLVGAPVESHVMLQCIVEAFPTPLNGWYKHDGELSLFLGVECLDQTIRRRKYVITEEKLNVFTWQLNLTVKNLQKSDFGAYLCSSINALGKADARIRLNDQDLQKLHPRAVEDKWELSFLASQLLKGPYHADQYRRRPRPVVGSRGSGWEC
ncbi:conserved hypothetical protein [Culex quinquefasciatus]|uniref:Ig-like domain-containing protein n=1 Tax=Culex quinquefasciatus TaxID=7176 RepID=B0X009_CULQU|nr:conserved hypothetical protein [Culex quinquefasciatus]|eukprot:XP_001862981.1 conserved hypothetical protein [Culex quinquefasciatus]